MKDLVRDGVLSSLRQLVDGDGHLFNCPIEEPSPYDARKLHEVCINHRLANHLEKEIIPVLGSEEPIFVDIEFNREGVDSKNIKIKGVDKIVRPDIIIHNRKTGSEKLNFLVVECKKQDASLKDFEEDRARILHFMMDEKYEYSFGLQVIYGSDKVWGTLFFKSGNKIKEDRLEV